MAGKPSRLLPRSSEQGLLIHVAPAGPEIDQSVEFRAEDFRRLPLGSVQGRVQGAVSESPVVAKALVAEWRRCTEGMPPQERPMHDLHPAKTRGCHEHMATIVLKDVLARELRQKVEGAWVRGRSGSRHDSMTIGSLKEN